jgi:transglutaminase/protease-like cytokinesis protein 3
MKWNTLLFLYISYFSFGQRTDFKSINFKKAESIATIYANESLKNLPVLTYKLTAHLSTDIEKFRAIYTWVSTTIENDYSSYLKTRKKRKKYADNQDALRDWNNSFTLKVFENLLKQKKTACTSYAYLIRELARLADINCKIIDGYRRTATLILTKNSIPNHSWNAVELDNKWYLCDATWSAGRILITEEGPKFQADYFDGYFLLEPELFAKNHQPLETKWTLMDNPLSFDQFLNGPVVYKEAFKNLLAPLFPEKMNIVAQKNETIKFGLKAYTSVPIKDFSLQITKGNYSRTIPKKSTKKENILMFNHTFSKTGRYDVHLKINEAIIATYVCTIRRN